MQQGPHHPQSHKYLVTGSLPKKKSLPATALEERMGFQWAELGQEKGVGREEQTSHLRNEGVTTRRKTPECCRDDGKTNWAEAEGPTISRHHGARLLCALLLSHLYY